MKAGSKINVKAGQVCPICKTVKLNAADLVEARLNGWEGCRWCFEEAGLENEHQDGYHNQDQDGLNANCPMCSNYIDPRAGHKEEKMDTNNCRCGCGAQVKGEYKQGHDAKHVSRLIAETMQGLGSVAGAMEELAGKPRLQVKFERAYNNAMTLARTKAEREALKAERAAAKSKQAKLRHAVKTGEVLSYSEVKIGRWWYPVETIQSDGDQFQVVYTDKHRTTKEAVVGVDKLK